jgi:hypothetical protein
MTSLEVLKVMRAQLDEAIAMLERSSVEDAPKKRGPGRPKKEKGEKSESEASEKPKRVMTPEHLAKMKAGREAAKAKRDAERAAAAAAEKDGEEAAGLMSEREHSLDTSIDASSVSDGGGAAGGRAPEKKLILKRKPKAASVVSEE